MSNKGIVCEIKKEYCVFLTSDGQFVRGIPASNVQVGDEAEFREYVPLIKKPSPMKRALIPVIAAAAVFILLFATILNPSQTVHAYVQVDGVEALEFGIDESGEVVEVRQLNGNELDSMADQYKGKSVEEVIETILTTGYDENKSVSITAVYTKKADETKRVIEQAITGVKEKFEDKEVTVYEATEKDREQANEKGMAIQKHLNQVQSDGKKPKKEKKQKPDVKVKPEDKKPGEKPRPENKNNNQKEHKNNGNNEKNQQPHPNNKEDQQKKQPPGQEKKDKNDKDQKQNNNGNAKGKDKDNQGNQGNQGERGNKDNNNGKGNGQGKEKNKDKDKSKDENNVEDLKNDE